MSVIDSIVEKVGDASELTSFYYDKWDMDIYYSKLTLAEQKKIERLSKNNTYDTVIYMLIEKAKDKDGEKLFTLADKNSLLTRLSGADIADVVGIITGMSDEDEIEKE